MAIWTPLLVLLGFVEPAIPPPTVVQPVVQTAPLVTAIQSDQTESASPPIVIDIQYQVGKRCVIPLTALIIQRNLTLAYHQQTVYGTAQCQHDN